MELSEYTTKELRTELSRRYKEKKVKPTINEEERRAFKEEVENALVLLIDGEKLDAWFFNDFSEDDICHHNRSINKYLNERLRVGHWEILDLEGNGTNVGKGVFIDKVHNVKLKLACMSDDEEFIDWYYIV